ncbi:putative Transcriptional regulatory protein moc3 [Drepanopeziza brunnea f. sp. 'multigermtubi' MB_m1]|uniref:Putative Transcriptional regulatory protein moc3 n=1 Tax=Marssonina brunnea f. sp. multigermtubi (strain MB_m1) TaxID=1072389 RepID=K1WJR2_MARBU|nr:putative Transcriptional regulatory protein moc3 [Drepanopeziza brunnea f. sp. 'multigermtubi' MB_m1]EKD17935.1 putative Transcriptional regulatory protein moc3 [Drepanopeziza brunnea f. sp. 'multigermtubi' MB_m1]
MSLGRTIGHFGDLKASAKMPSKPDVVEHVSPAACQAFTSQPPAATSIECDAPQPDAMPKERKRKHHQRSKAGCITCKKRHRRCDEARPFCALQSDSVQSHNCLKTGGSCGYPDSTTPSVDGNEIGKDLHHDQRWLLNLPVLQYDYTTHCSCLPDRLSGVSKMLFNHGATYNTLTRQAVTKKYRHAEIEFSTSDIAVLHSVLHLTANHWVATGGDPGYMAPALYHHKLEAMRIIRERLRDPEQATTDGTVGGIAILILAESDTKAGAVRKSQDRGASPRWPGNSDEASRWHAYQHAKRLSISADLFLPRFYGGSVTRSTHITPKAKAKPSSTLSSTKIVVAPPPGSDSPFFPTDVMGSRFHTTGGFPDRDLDSLAQMFRHLRTHSALAAAFENGSSPIHEAEILSRLCAIERFIDSLVHGGAGAGSDHTTLLLPQNANRPLHNTNKPDTVPMRPCGFVGSIYIYLFLRKIPLASPVFDYMVSLVREELERFGEEEKVLEGSVPAEVVFWMLFVAGVASVEREERGWFVRRLKIVRGVLGLRGWEEARRLLGTLAWADGMGDEGGRRLWELLLGRGP